MRIFANMSVLITRISSSFPKTSVISCCNCNVIFRSNSFQANNDGPLCGIRVLDLTRILAGPFATQILGDLGAEIIKVEKPGSGDDTRSWTPPSINNQSCYFVAINRNKKSIALDIQRGTSILHKLVKSSDILVENFLPGTLARFKMDYETLQRINPRLIYCSITGYGSSGPYMNRGGYDVIAASLGGLLHITGPRGGEPCKVGVAMTDLATGLYAHGAILAALLERNKSGLGQLIECNLLSTQLSCLVNLASNYLNAGIDAQKWGTAHESIVPYQSFKTKDERWITIGAGNDPLFHQLCDVLGLHDLKSDLRFLSNSLRVQHREELITILSEELESQNCEYWLAAFKDCKFPYGPVNDLHHAFNDPQVLHNQVVEQIGPYHVVGPAVKYSRLGNRIRSEPPKLGQHTRQILQSLKLSGLEIDELYRNGTVQ